MSARNDTIALQARLNRAGIAATWDDANTLRRAELTLQRWAELECGDGNEWGSWAIERDDTGEGPPYMVHHHYAHGAGKDRVTRTRIPDREAGALRRVAEVCRRLGCHYYHQTDPRGCALYVSAESLKDHDYTRGIACCV